MDSRRAAGPTADLPRLVPAPSIFATTGEDALIELEILGNMFEDIYKGCGLLGGSVSSSDPEYWRR